MTTITITTLQFQPAVEFAEKLQSIVSYAESLFGAVDIDFVVTPTVTAATYEAAMQEFDAILADVRAQPLVRLTDEQLEEIEKERVGEEFSIRPWEW